MVYPIFKILFMMKIAYIVPSLANKGPVIVVKELVRQMRYNGHDCIVFYFDNIIQLEFVCPTEKISQDLPIDFLKFDVVHSHGMRPDRYIWRFREYSGKVSYISTIHNYILQDLQYQYNWLVAQIYGRLWISWLKRHDRVVVLSQDALKYYNRWFDNNRMHFVYNTRNLDKSETLTNEEVDELIKFRGSYKLIGINALLSNRKGVDIVIEALRDLHEYKLFIVGDGKSRKKLEHLAHCMKVEKRCYFAGIKPNAYRYLPYYDIYAMPSRSEGFPLSLLEAAIYSKNSVVSDIPVVKEAFSVEEVSMFSLKNPESIVAAILNATDNILMGEKMNFKYLQCYSPEQMYQKYVSIYINRTNK